MKGKLSKLSNISSIQWTWKHRLSQSKHTKSNAHRNKLIVIVFILNLIDLLVLSLTSRQLCACSASGILELWWGGIREDSGGGDNVLGEDPINQDLESLLSNVTVLQAPIQYS